MSQWIMAIHWHICQCDNARTAAACSPGTRCSSSGANRCAKPSSRPAFRRIGTRKGLQQGLQRQRHGLLRMVRKRFGAEVAEQSEPLLERIDDPERLEDLGEALLDSADGDAWLRVLRSVADRQG